MRRAPMIWECDHCVRYQTAVPWLFPRVGDGFQIVLRWYVNRHRSSSTVGAATIPLDTRHVPRSMHGRGQLARLKYHRAAAYAPHGGPHLGKYDAPLGRAREDEAALALAAIEPIGVVERAAAQSEDVRKPLQIEQMVVAHLPQKFSVTRFRLESDRCS